MLEHKKDDLKAWLFLAPMLISLAIWTFYPMITTMAVAFFPQHRHLEAIHGMQGAWGSAGLDSFRMVLTDSLFHRALLNSFIMMIINVPLGIGAALAVAVALYSIPKVKGFFQTIFFLPYVTNTMAFGMVFVMIFSPQSSGLANTMLNWFGIDPVTWTGDIGIPTWAGFTVIAVQSIWNGLAFRILILMGGLAAIDKQYYQAAQIDGADKRRVFRRITIPLLSPMLAFLMILALMGSFQAYNSVVALFGENMGPDRQFITAVGYIYFWFDNVWGAPVVGTGFLSRASAAAVIIFIIVFAMTAFQMWFNKRRVHY